MGGLDPRVVLIVGAILGTIWLGEQAAKGVETGFHKAKCGIEHIVGKHCQPKTEQIKP